MAKRNRVYESHQPGSIDLSGVDPPKPPFIIDPNGKENIMVQVSEVVGFQPEEGFDPPKPVLAHKGTEENEL